MKWRWFVALIPVIISCENIPVETQVDTTLPTVATDNWKAEIDSVMSAQEMAWNTGQLEDFMQAYIQSDSLMFIGSRGLNYGWQTTLGNYQKSYPDKEAMGTLKFENLEYKKLGDENALVIGLWNLYRTTDTLKGSYSLNWQYIDGQWKIIADHSS